VYVCVCVLRGWGWEVGMIVVLVRINNGDGLRLCRHARVGCARDSIGMAGIQV
jgi:hypothetical protein